MLTVMSMKVLNVGSSFAAVDWSSFVFTTGGGSDAAAVRLLY